GSGRTTLGQLFKILDAAESLSFQAHERFKPDSKNERWMVVIDREALQGQPDQGIAEIYLGFRPVAEMDAPELAAFKSRYLRLIAQGKEVEARALFQAEYARALQEGRTDTTGAKIKGFCNKIEVRWEKGAAELYLNGAKQSEEMKKRMGMQNDMLVMNIPGATVHALSYGVVYELQETADKTLRLYDNGRDDPKRPLHVQEAMAILDFTERDPQKYLLAPVLLGDGLTCNLIRTPLYSMDYIALDAAAPGQAGTVQLPVPVQNSYQMLMVKSGSGKLRYVSQADDEVYELDLKQGDSFIVPANMEGYELSTEGRLTLLKAYEATPGEMKETQDKRGKSFWEAEGFFGPQAAAAEKQPENEQAVVREMRRLRNILPWNMINVPLRGLRQLPSRIIHYVAASLLFVLDRGAGGNLSLRLPLRAIASILLLPLVILQGVAGLAMDARGAQPVLVNDNTPRFAAIKRMFMIPDAAMAKKFNISQAHFRSLSERGSLFKRLLTGEWLGAYAREAADPDKKERTSWVDIYVPDVLLKTMATDMPDKDGTLRTTIRRLNYRLQAFLFGVIVGYQAQKYHMESRYDPVAETLGLRSYVSAPAVRPGAVANLRGGKMTAAAWQRKNQKAKKMSVHPAEIISLVSDYLAEARQALEQPQDQSLEQVWEAIARDNDEGASAQLGQVLKTVAGMEELTIGSMAAVLQGLAKESEGFAEKEKSAIAANAVLRSLLERIEPVEGAEQRDIAQADPVAKQEVYLLSLPDAYGQQLAALDAAIKALEEKKIAAGLRNRLRLVKQVLESTKMGTVAGKMVKLADTALARQLRAEIIRQNNTAPVRAQKRKVGEDLNHKVHLVQTRNVATPEVEGITMANTMLYEVREAIKVDGQPVSKEVTLADLQQKTLPENVSATVYQGERAARMAVPEARHTMLTALAGHIATRRVHQLAMKDSPMGYLQAVLAKVSVPASRLRELLEQGDSPVIQAYLQFVQNPTRRTEREFVKSMLRVIKAQAREAKTPVALAALDDSIATYSDMVTAMKALTPARTIGVWTALGPEQRIGKPLQSAGVLFEMGGMADFGALYDILNDTEKALPVKVDENKLEMQRRRLFKSTMVAA
ncbi:hypothetical protein JW933_06145, partial [candidate division FCPU426 bacterium]|nr:hypothetical protein [candidate division FCPU426 bacterium]